MPSLAEEIFAETALPVLFTQHGQSVIYSTPAGAFAVDAIPSNPASRMSGDAIVPVGVELCDFLIESSELEGNGVDTPASGHEIAWTRGVRRDVYMVSPPARDMQCYERGGASGTLLRIHTKLVATE